MTNYEVNAPSRFEDYHSHMSLFYGRRLVAGFHGQNSRSSHKADTRMAYYN